jgi:hypothetical protein
MQKYWEEKWEKEKSEKSTMKFLDIKKKPIGNPHQILNLAPKTTLEVRKAEVKAKLITRTYNRTRQNLQKTRRMRYVPYAIVTQRIPSIFY